MVVSHQGRNGCVIEILLDPNVEFPEPEPLESVLDIDQIFLDFFKIGEPTEVFFLLKFGV